MFVYAEQKRVSLPRMRKLVNVGFKKPIKTLKLEPIRISMLLKDVIKYQV